MLARREDDHAFDFLTLNNMGADPSTDNSVLEALRHHVNGEVQHGPSDPRAEPHPSPILGLLAMPLP